MAPPSKKTVNQVSLEPTNCSPNLEVCPRGTSTHKCGSHLHSILKQPPPLPRKATCGFEALPKLSPAGGADPGLEA